MDRRLLAGYAVAAVALGLAPLALDAYQVDVLNSVGLYSTLR